MAATRYAGCVRFPRRFSYGAKEWRLDRLFGFLFFKGKVVPSGVISS